MTLIDKAFIIFESIIIVLLITSWYNIKQSKKEKDTITTPKPQIKTPTIRQIHPDNKNKIYQLNTTKIGVVKAVLKWAIENIPNPNKRNKIPAIEISYNKPKTKYGVYYSYTKSMCIYVNAHTNLLELCDTVLHEYKHHLDMPTQAHQNKYNNYTQSVGYYNNPFEIAAREFALQHRDKCMQDLYHLGYLI